MTKQDLLNVLHLDVKRQIVEIIQSDNWKSLKKISDLYNGYNKCEKKIIKLAEISEEKIKKPEDLYKYIVDILTPEKFSIFYYLKFDLNYFIECDYLFDLYKYFEISNKKFSLSSSNPICLNIVKNVNSKHFELLDYILGKVPFDINEQLVLWGEKEIDLLLVGWNLLDIAMQNKNDKAIEILLKHGAKNSELFIELENQND